jgi:hypothetical protein
MSEQNRAGSALTAKRLGDDGLRLIRTSREDKSMNREELFALRTALDQTLSWPDHVREAIMQWLTPQASKPNGLGNGAGQERLKTLDEALENRQAIKRTPANPEPAAPDFRRPAAPTPYAGKAPRGRPPISAKAAEQRLLAAMRETPGLSAALAKAAGGGRSATGERLRQLAA